jgi:drug/metabolite transporter (DMT)-like permease
MRPGVKVHSFNETFTILFCVLLTAAGQIALKLGASSPALSGFIASGNVQAFIGRALVSPTVLAGLLLYAASTVLWLLILARSDLSFAYPFVSLGFVITTLFGWQMLGEVMSGSRITGIALIICGVIMVARS